MHWLVGEKIGSTIAARLRFASSGAGRLLPYVTVYRSFCRSSPTPKRVSMAHPVTTTDLSGVHVSQIDFLKKDECILVDTTDKVVGSASKLVCHLQANIRTGMLHRAFSLFVFNAKDQLLLQRRANVKVTYPGHMTNTCCSHPLSTAPELEEGSGAIGVRRAAQRKVKHELGVEAEHLKLDDISYITRILYQADNSPDDGTWGEHELDYILVARASPELIPNPTEVSETHWVSRSQFPGFLANCEARGVPLTPWFRLIIGNGYLDRIWTHLDELDTVADHSNILNFKTNN